MLLDSLAFVTHGVDHPEGSDHGSDQEDFLMVARNARLTLFDQENEEEQEEMGGVNWDTLLFETHENIHENSLEVGGQDLPLERAATAQWFPFKSQEVSSMHILGSCPISKGPLVGMITAGPLLIPKYDSTASLRLPDHWIYVACHVLC
jgi:hypothetical protein